MGLLERLAKTTILAIGLTGVFGGESKAQVPGTSYEPPESSSENKILEFMLDSFYGPSIPFLAERQLPYFELPYFERNEVFDEYGLTSKVRFATGSFLLNLFQNFLQALDYDG